MSFVSGIASIFNADLIKSGKVLKGEAGCKDVEIKGNYVIIQTDHKDFKEKVLCNIYKAGEARRISDYVIVSDDVILVCEMKSNNAGENTQLKNTGMFVRYLLEMIKEHAGVNIKIPPIKYVCFSNRYAYNKQTAKPDKLVRNKWNNSEKFFLQCNSIYLLKQFN